MPQALRPKRRQAPKREDEIYCKNRRRYLTRGKCLDDYLNANAMEKRRSACWRCWHGKRTRLEYSED